MTEELSMILHIPAEKYDAMQSELASLRAEVERLRAALFEEER